MRGNRGPRGLTDRAGKIEGTGYTGDPAGVIKPWTGSGVSTPAIGQYPTIPIPIDDNDDGSAAVDRVDATKTSGRKSTRDTTKARFQGLKILANFAAWFMDVVKGTRSMKAVVVDGVGGAAAAGVAGNISATQDISSGRDLNVGRNGLVTGTLLSVAATAKSMWRSAQAFVFATGTWQFSLSGQVNVTALTGGLAKARVDIPLPFSGANGSAELTDVNVYVVKADGTGMTVNLNLADAVGGTFANVATTTFNAVGQHVIGLHGLSVPADSTHYLWLEIISQAAGDEIFGVRVDYTSNVF